MTRHLSPPDISLNARKALRVGTSGCHERVDALFSAFDLTSREGYARFLQAQAAAMMPAEAALDAADAGRFVADWAARKRSIALRADLEALERSVPEGIPTPAFEGEAGVLGAIYVLEGSRLGGALLKRSLPVGLPTAFLAPGEPGSWRALLQILDERLKTADEIGAATKSAEQVFNLFETAGRTIQESCV